MEEGGLVEDTTLAMEEETEVVRTGEALDSVAFSRMEGDHFGKVGTEQGRKFTPGNFEC